MKNDFELVRFSWRRRPPETKEMFGEIEATAVFRNSDGVELTLPISDFQAKEIGKELQTKFSAQLPRVGSSVNYERTENKYRREDG